MFGDTDLFLRTPEKNIEQNEMEEERNMKKLLGIFLAMLLLLGLLPVTALADPSPTAISVGDALELTAAITNIADGGTITLVNTFSSGDTKFVIPTDKTIILDLNGHTITTTTNNFLTVGAHAALTINDSNSGDEGGLREAGGAWKQLIKNEGTLVINAGIFDSSSLTPEGNFFTVVMFTDSITTINGGTFIGVLSDNGTWSGQKITINGGIFRQMLYLPSASQTVTINGGTFDLNDVAEIDSVIEIDAGTLNITGGTFKLDIDTSGNTSASTNNNGSGYYKGVIVACKPSGSKTGSYGSKAEVNISGGIFENNDGDCLVAADQTKTGNEGGGTASFRVSGGKFTGALAVYDTSENEKNKPYITVTGGYYTEDPEAFVPEDEEYLVRHLSGLYLYKVTSADAEEEEDDDDEEDLSVTGSGVEAERLNKATEEYQTLKNFAVSAGFETGDIIKSWDLDLSGKGPWKLTFELGKEYAGETVTIYHLKKDGKIETFVVTANKNGDAKISVTSASPFIVVEGKAETSGTSGETVKEENPNTGVSEATALVSALAVISLIAGAAVAFKK